MQIETTGHRMAVSSYLRSLVTAKMARVFRHLSDAGLSATVVVSREKIPSLVEVTVHARGENFLHAIGNGPSWQFASTMVAARLDHEKIIEKADVHLPLTEREPLPRILHKLPAQGEKSFFDTCAVIFAQIEEGVCRCCSRRLFPLDNAGGAEPVETGKEVKGVVVCMETVHAFEMTGKLVWVILTFSLAQSLVISKDVNDLLTAGEPRLANACKDAAASLFDCHDLAHCELVDYLQLRIGEHPLEETEEMVRLRAKQRPSRETILRMHRELDGGAAGLVLVPLHNYHPSYIATRAVKQ